MQGERPLLIVLLLVISTSAQALECRELANDTSKDLGHVIATCLLPTIPVVEEKRENVTHVVNITNEDGPEDPPVYGPRRGLRVRREEVGIATAAPTNRSNTNYSYDNGDAHDPTRCVAHCIMASYNMIGARGFPELNKIARTLLKDNSNRELRDLVQDTIDECFLQLSESPDLDACTYSARLVTCLADRAKFNCSDWPVGELPFPHKF